MKISKVYRDAAKNLNLRGGRLYSVIGGFDDKPLHPGHRYFWELFKGGASEDWTKRERVLALLFAAAIAESEGL